MSEKFVIDGEHLKPRSLWHFVAQHANVTKPQFKIEIANAAQNKVKLAAQYVERVVQEGKPVYGINTGFGKFAEVSISIEQLAELQNNLILSHACGVGPLLSREQVMGMWLLRLNTLARGNSGIRLETINRIVTLLEAGVLACIPSKGSVGASGDLAPSAHAVLTLLGEGQCTMPHDGKMVTLSAKEALSKLGLKPLVLAPKEGLALINGTQTTTILATQAWYNGIRLLESANCAAALSIEGLRGTHKIAHPKIAQLRNHPGAVHCAAQIRSWLDGASEVAQSHANCGRVQDPYSLRCAPQVHGAIFDELMHAELVLEREMNSSTDNPLLIPEDHLSLSGGNFHAIYTARVSDALSSALTTLGTISERRIALFMNKESSLLPHFLTENGGLNSGFMMAQVTAAALVSECKSLSFPASVDSIPTSGDKEDHVSMGPIAGQKAVQIAENLHSVLAIEFLCGAQALSLLAPLKPAVKLQGIYKKIRAHVPKLERDRILSTDFDQIITMIRQGEFLL